MTNPGIAIIKDQPAFTDEVAFDRDLVVAWVDALESGQFKQGRGFLRTETGGGARMCCLGVLVEVAGLRGYPVWWDDEPADDHIEAKWRDAKPGDDTKAMPRASSHKIPDGLALAVGLGSGLGEKPRGAVQVGDSLLDGITWALTSPFEHDHGREMGFASLAGANDDGVDFLAIAAGIRRAILGQDATDPSRGQAQ